MLTARSEQPQLCCKRILRVQALDSSVRQPPEIPRSPTVVAIILLEELKFLYMYISYMNGWRTGEREWMAHGREKMPGRGGGETAGSSVRVRRPGHHRVGRCRQWLRLFLKRSASLPDDISASASSPSRPGGGPVGGPPGSPGTGFWPGNHDSESSSSAKQPGRT